jgi:hypothetical protein
LIDRGNCADTASLPRDWVDVGVRARSMIVNCSVFDSRHIKNDACVRRDGAFRPRAGRLR